MVSREVPARKAAAPMSANTPGSAQAQSTWYALLLLSLYALVALSKEVEEEKCNIYVCEDGNG